MKATLLCLQLMMCLLLLSCQPRNKSANQDLQDLVQLMTGKFSSEQQSLNDDRYFHISLKMQSIWPDSSPGQWLYVEQAVGTQLDKPYRQRIYHLTELAAGRFSSAVYELPDPEAVVGGYENPSLLDGINPDQLTLRTGCAVILTQTGDSLFQGSTQEKACLSQLRGATYATSKVAISADAITSWDQGFNANDEQVWGAVAGPYVFDRLNTDSSGL